MRPSKPLYLLTAAVACGLIAAGCGGDDESSDSDSTSSDQTTSTEATETIETTETTTTDEGSGGVEAGEVDSESVFEACADAIAGTPVEGSEEAVCGGVRDAFEQCASQGDEANCQDVADEAIDVLRQAAEKASG